MGWTRDPSGELAWTVTLTAADPTAPPLPVAYLRAATVQVDGVFGAGSVELQLGNVPTRLIAVETLRHAELVPLTPMLPVGYLGATVETPSDETAITVTVVAAR